MAGESNVTTATKDSLNEVLVNSFDANRVNEEIGVQVEITRAFGVEAPKAVGDFASNKQLQLILEGNLEEAEKWAEGGSYRVALHSLVGALATGSIDGAVASGTTAVSVPALDNYLKTQRLDDTARKVVLQGFSASVGASIGGDTASAVSSFNQTNYNYLSHKQMQEWIDALAKGVTPRRRDEINSYYLREDRDQQADFINDCQTNYNYQRCKEQVEKFHEGNTYRGSTLFDPNLYSTIERLGNVDLTRTVISHNNYVFLNNSRWEGEVADRYDGLPGVIAQGAVGVGSPRTPKTAMLGANGTQISSKTVWNQKGSKARIDVENPNHGQRPG